jgi:hypothetical protein
MRTKLGIIIWQHAVKAIYRRYIKNKKIIHIIEQADQQEGGEGGESKGENPRARMRNTPGPGTTSIADGFYGRLISESIFSTESMRHAFRRIIHNIYS